MKTKRILAYLLSIVMALSLSPVTTLADDENVTIGSITSSSWTPTPSTDSSVATTGEWTAAGNYDIAWYSENLSTKTVTITTAEQLAGLAVITNGLNGERQRNLEGWTITLGNDIDISGKTWTPISNQAYPAFNGTFDGGNHTVKGLTIKGDVTGYAGLFGYTQKLSIIKNVKMSDVYININGGYSSGAVTGIILGSAENCHVLSGEITKTGTSGYYDGFGGVIGELGEESTVKNCSNAATVYYVHVSGGNSPYIGGVTGLT